MNEEQELKTYIEQANKKRREWAESDAKRDAGVGEPAHVRKVTDISYAESDTEDETRWHLLDIYYPEKDRTLVKDGKYPVIVSIHGGGWFYGDKELYRLYAMTLATYGFAVVNCNYRLSPEYPYPAGFMDVCKVMEFLIQHAEQYELDSNRIYMVGDSAGAQLVSQYCIYATNENYRALFPFGEEISTVVPNKVALNCGVYDGGARFYRDKVCNWYLPFTMHKNLAASFFRMFDYMTADFPETYLMLSVNDMFAKDTAPMKQKLEELSVPFIYREFGLGVPSDGHVFHLNLRSENGKRANREEIEFFITE